MHSLDKPLQERFTLVVITHLMLQDGPVMEQPHIPRRRRQATVAENTRRLPVPL